MLSGKFAVVKSRSNSNPTFPVVPRVPGVALTLNPRLIALGLRPRHSPLVVGYRRGGYNKKPIHNPLNKNHFKQNRAGRLVASGTWREVER